MTTSSEEESPRDAEGRVEGGKRLGREHRHAAQIRALDEFDARPARARWANAVRAGRARPAGSSTSSCHLCRQALLGHRRAAPWALRVGCVVWGASKVWLTLGVASAAIS